MCRWIEAELRKGIRVCSNVPVVGCDFVPDFAALIKWCALNPNGSAFIDEAGVVLNARNWAKIPFEVQALFAQHRHYGIDLYWFAQRLDQVDKSLRELSQYITLVQKVWPGFPTSPKNGEYLGVPIFREKTYEPPNLKETKWDEYFFYSSRWASMVDVTHIKGVDEAQEAAVKEAMQAWQTRKVSADGLRLR